MKKKIIAVILGIIALLLIDVNSASAETVTKTIDASKDTWLDELNPTATHWSEISTKVGIYYSDPLHRYYYTTLIYFDYLPVIPAGATVTSAKMKLWAFSCSGESSAEIVVNEIIHDWNSSTNEGNFFPGYGGEAYSEFIVDGCGKYIEADVLPVVNDIRNNNHPNYGFFLNNMRGGPAFTRAFCTSEYGDYGPRPKLIITYTTADSSSTGTNGQDTTSGSTSTGSSGSQNKSKKSSVDTITPTTNTDNSQAVSASIAEKSKSFRDKIVSYYKNLNPFLQFVVLLLGLYYSLLFLAFLVALIISIVALVKNHRRNTLSKKLAKS